MNNRITDDLDGIVCEVEEGTSPPEPSSNGHTSQPAADPEQAAIRTIQEGRQQRLKEFGEALNRLGQQYRCRLFVWQELMDGVPQGRPEIRVALAD
jgi:hypothetical protein